MEDLTQYNDKINEIFRSEPSWITKWGTSVIIVFLIIIAMLASLVKYNDVITAEAVITTKNPPVKIFAQRTGKIETILVGNEEIVSQGQVIAVLESAANYGDVAYLKNILFNETLLSKERFDNLSSFPFNLQLGSIQMHYKEFRLKLRNYQKVNDLNLSSRNQVIMQSQINLGKASLANKERQLLHYKERLNISETLYNKYKKVYDSNTGSISELEFMEEKSAYLSAKQGYEYLLYDIKNERKQLRQLEGELIGLDDRKFEEEILVVQSLHESISELKNQISLWEQKNLIRSPKDGKIIFEKFWGPQQYVKNGDPIFTVVPIINDEIVGELFIPIKNSGKLKLNQEVIVKLENYPFREWGVLKGKILTISNTTGQSNKYRATMKIESLNTSVGKKIKMNMELMGTGEVILEELSILERIFYQFRGINP